MCIVRKKKHLAWQKMTNYGIVERDVLELLMTQYKDSCDKIVTLMIKFGLLVQLQSAEHGKVSLSSSISSTNVEYLVPALLPSKHKSEHWSDQVS